MDEQKKHSNPSPLNSAGFISKLFFCWLNPIFIVGKSKSLELSDLYNIPEEDTSKYICDSLEREWEKELAKNNRKPSLLRAIIRSFGVRYMLCGLIAFFEELLKVVQPILIGGLISYFRRDSTVSMNTALYYAMGISFATIGVALVHHPYFFIVQRIGMQMRIACCSLLYKKALKLNNSSLGKTTIGQIVNLMSNDVNRFDQGVLFLHYLWIGPIQAAIVLTILCNMIGPSALAGFALLLLLIPVQTLMSRLFTVLRRKTATQTDARVRLMNEIISGIRVIKTYCWEKLFSELVGKVRNLEIKRISVSGYFRALTLAPFFASVKIVLFFTVLTMSLSGIQLKASNVFMVLGIFDALRVTLCLFVPLAITYGSESVLSLRRVQEFLLLEELEPPLPLSANSESDKPIVKANKISASWDNNEVPMISEISFEAKPGDLIAIIGPVGSGKSSLLLSLVEQMHIISGDVTTRGKIAYVPQVPWIFSSTVRQNILFGQPFDQVRYNRAIKVSALKMDLKLMEKGDQTLVGERGVSLSGGQKARICLARAVYSDSDIYLLDDPLSAVDIKVSAHLFEECIRGILKKKIRLLVTHQVQMLQTATLILIMKDGKIDGRGTYDELAKSGIDFSSLLKRHEEESEDNQDHINSNVSLSQSVLAKDDDDDDDNNFHETEPFLRSNSLSNTRKNCLNSKKSASRNSLNSKKSSSRLSLTSKRSLRLRSSATSLASFKTEGEAEFIAPVREEQIAKGTVRLSVYWKYMISGAGIFGLFVLVLINVASQLAYVGCDLWLSYWTHVEEERQSELNAQNLEYERFNSSNITVREVNTNTNIAIYSGFTFAVFVFGMLRALFIFHILISAAKTLHNAMFKAILGCPVLFFDTNPVGRILNRFSKDTGQMDELLPLTWFDFIQCAMQIAAIVILTGSANPWVFLAVAPLALVFIYIRSYFLSTTRDVKRLEGTSRSPVFSHVSATLQGLQTIRIFRVQDVFTKEFHQHQDAHSEAWFMFLCTTRWFAIRLDWLCTLFVIFVCFSVIFSKLDSGIVGLSLTYSISLLGLFQWGVRQSAEVENQMTSVERIMEYSKLEQEAKSSSDPDDKPPPSWPEKGQIKVTNLYFKYSKDGPLVLKNLNFEIYPEEKIGIVGRTGAGKSSLISTFFRLAEPQGVIEIDHYNILKLGLQDVRSKISIIPQDPVLFNGTVRQNIDPFNQHDDKEIWSALEEVRMKDAVNDLPSGLQAGVSEGGGNFSVGQRQLFCLARAVLKHNKIMIIDEATANVDPITDSLIQTTIKEKFKNCTVLTIAHRLHTIINSDRILVLDQGLIVEFDEPYRLLEKTDGFLYSMVKQTGDNESTRLNEIAKQVADKHKLDNRYSRTETNGVEK